VENKPVNGCLLAILRCPISGQPLRPATAEEAERLGFNAALAAEDGRVLYPVEGGIPLLVAAAAWDARGSGL